MSTDAAPRFETSIAPWLTVNDAQGAVAFYTAAFDAVELYRLEGDGANLEVARLSIDGATFWVQRDIDAPPAAPGTRPVRMILTVQDPEAVFARAVAAGAAAVAPVSEAHGWRTGRLTDPFGHDWEVSRQLASS